MNLYDKKALFIGSHTDDIENGCGGYIQRFKNKRIIVFSPATISIPDTFQKDSTVREFTESCKLMSCSDYILHTFETRRFNENRQDILEELIKQRELFNPEIVFTHSSDDMHQDHMVIHQETLRAFKNSSILGYDVPRNYLHRSFNYFVTLSEEELSNKLKYMSCYKSQLIKKKDELKFIESHMRLQGEILNKGIIESYELIRWFE